MDFIEGLPCTSHGYNLIWVIVDRLTKSMHFIPVATTYKVGQYADLYISHIVQYHGIPKTIISDRGSIFVAHFLEQLHECLGTHLIRSSAYHPQTDGQTERVNQIIEDMLHACVLTDGPKWDKNFPVAEFSYNNSYQESIKMSPFEALYGRPCRTPLSWSKSGERVIFGPDIVTEAEEKVKQIQANILAAQSRQKSYPDKRRSLLEFEVGDHVYLRVSPMKGVCHFGIKGKLAPRYIGPYSIIDKHGPTSYQVELPARLSGVHIVFHVSQLKKCLKPPTNMVIEDTIPLEPDLTYKAHPVKVLGQQDRVTRNKTTRFYKIQWNNHSKDEVTWEHEEFLRSNYPEFLPSR
jgi:ribosomal protein L21E